MTSPVADARRVRAESFGERLRRLRVAGGVSCAQLAQRVGVTEGAIRQMESGQTKIASFIIGLRLAKELGTDPWYLANGIADHHAEAQAGVDGIVLRVSALERRIASLLAERTCEG